MRGEEKAGIVEEEITDLYQERASLQHHRIEAILSR
jgi:hypothetical protein